MSTPRKEDRSVQPMKQELRELLKIHSIRHGKFTLSSGEESDFYFDGKMVTMLPKGMQLIGKLMLKELDDLDELRAIGGLTLGADPIAAAVSLLSVDTPRPIPMFLVRKEPKSHGTRKMIEGQFPEEDGAPVVIVDDVITKGGSVLQAITEVEKAGAKVARVIVVVDRQEGGAERLRQKGYDVRSLFTREDFDLHQEPSPEQMLLHLK